MKCWMGMYHVARLETLHKKHNGFRHGFWCLPPNWWDFSWFSLASPCARSMLFILSGDPCHDRATRWMSIPMGPMGPFLTLRLVHLPWSICRWDLHHVASNQQLDPENRVPFDLENVRTSVISYFPTRSRVYVCWEDGNHNKSSGQYS